MVTEETAGNNVFNILVKNNWFSMLLFTAIFVFNKPTVLQGSYAEDTPAVPIWLFNVNRIET